MGTAGLAGESSTISSVSVLGTVAVAPPRNGGNLFIDVRLALGASVTGDGVEVVRERDLSMINLLVVGLESCRIYLGVIVTIHIIKCWCPFTNPVSPLRTPVPETCLGRTHSIRTYRSGSPPMGIPLAARRW